jgi:hypothetical protein
MERERSRAAAQTSSTEEAPLLHGGEAKATLYVSTSFIISLSFLFSNPEPQMKLMDLTSPCYCF